MIDLGLLASILAAAAAPWLVARLVPAPGDRPVDGDALLTSAVAGLVAGRLVFVALEDPRSFARIGDLMIIRSGVEFWPGVAVAVIILSNLGRRAGRAIPETLALASPLFLVGYGAYEAACGLREGCFGPSSSIGLTPPGFSTPVFPIGWAVAVVTIAAGALLRRRSPSDAHVAVIALLVVASARALAGFSLPRVGSGLSRPHLESLVVATVALAVHLAAGAQGRHTTSSRTRALDSPNPTAPDPRKGP